MKLLPAIAIISGLTGCASTSLVASCPVSGDAVQWQADYCLFATGTDDLVAAQPCIDHEAKSQFQDACAEKEHYKERMCMLVVGAGSRLGTIDQCMKDSQFSGPVVRNGGAQ